MDLPYTIVLRTKPCDQDASKSVWSLQNEASVCKSSAHAHSEIFPLRIAAYEAGYVEQWLCFGRLCGTGVSGASWSAGSDMASQLCYAIARVGASVAVVNCLRCSMRFATSAVIS
eukprot:6205582-Pleurochrysis_carterae.AAC.1